MGMNCFSQIILQNRRSVELLRVEQKQRICRNGSLWYTPPGGSTRSLAFPLFHPAQDYFLTLGAFWVTRITRTSGDDAEGWKGKFLKGRAKGVMKL